MNKKVCLKQLVGIVIHTIRGTNMKKEVFIAEFVKKYGSLPPERILKENRNFKSLLS